MTTTVALRHTTTYRFDRSVGLGPHVVRLRPAPHTRTTVTAYALHVGPAEHFVNWQQDPFGNYLARLVFREPARELTIDVDLVAELGVVNPFDFFVEPYAESYPFGYDRQLTADLAPYLATFDGDSPVLDGWLQTLPERYPHLRFATAPVRTLDVVLALNQAVYDTVAYSVRMEVGVQTPDHTLERAVGSCRDSGWLLVNALRRLGLAARFVSGYLVQLASDDPADGGPTADFTDLHAWAEVYLPGAGWIGLDPTSALAAGEGHIPLCATPTPAGSAPITGATDPCEVTFEFANTVTRVREEFRTTQPYAEADWVRVLALGDHVDGRIAAQGLELTQGGEPTFVSVDDMTDPQWTVAADGADKRAKAERLARRLFDRYAGAGGLIQRSQGKWYPGEPLPRWQIGLIWRLDGRPLWTDPALLADPVPLDPDGSGPGEAWNTYGELQQWLKSLT